MRTLLVFTENYGIGGGNRYLADLVNGLAQGYGRVKIAYNPGGLTAGEVDRMSLKAELKKLPVLSRDLFFTNFSFFRSSLGRTALRISLPLEPLFLIYDFLCFLLFLAIERPDTVLVCFGGYPGALSLQAMCLASAALRIKTAMSVVSTPMPRRYGAVSRISDALLWRAVDLVIVNAASVGAALSGYRGLPEGAAHVVHNGVGRPSSRSVPRALDGKFVFGYVGRIEKAKGVPILVEAFRKLLTERGGVKLLLAGPAGDASSGIAAMVREQRLEEDIQILGPYDGDITELVNGFDAFVLPSLWEGLPYVVLEAMSCGKPVIATSVGGVPEAVIDRKTGLLVDPNSVEQLAAAMAKLAEDGDAVVRMGKAGREKYERDFTAEAMKARLAMVWPAVGRGRG